MNLTKHGFHNDVLKPLRFLSSWLRKIAKVKITDLVKMCLPKMCLPIFKHMFPTKLLTSI